MAYYYIDHIVHDFNAWKAVYDQHAELREAHGIVDYQVLQSIDNPNRVLVYGRGEIEMIRKFILSDEASEAMRMAGVAGPPTVFIGEDQLL